MNRTGLLIALAIAVVVGILFALYAELDLTLSGIFYDAATRRWRVLDTPTGKLRHVASWLIALVVAPAVIALLVKLVLTRRPMLVPGRAIVLMISTLVLGPGLLVNVILKDNSGRPRPLYVTEFGGQEHFRPWWDMRGDCEKNCSFVAGEPSGAFWTMAGAAVVPPHWRGPGGRAAHVGGRAFLHRRGVQRHRRLPADLASPRLAVPLADASLRRRHRALARTRRNARL